MSSSVEEEGRNQGMMGNQLTLRQVVEGEGSLQGWTHTHADTDTDTDTDRHTHAHTHTHQEKQKRLIKYFPFFPTFKLSQEQTPQH